MPRVLLGLLGGVLGDVEPVVVASAFGYFNPEVVDALWNAGRAMVAAGRGSIIITLAIARRAKCSWRMNRSLMAPRPTRWPI